jgi:hypothetical protein
MYAPMVVRSFPIGLDEYMQIKMPVVQHDAVVHHARLGRTVFLIPQGVVSRRIPLPIPVQIGFEMPTGVEVSDVRNAADRLEDAGFTVRRFTNSPRMHVAAERDDFIVHIEVGGPDLPYALISAPPSVTWQDWAAFLDASHAAVRTLARASDDVATWTAYDDEGFLQEDAVFVINGAISTRMYPHP